MSLPVWSHPVAAITDEERRNRLSRLRERMQTHGIAATLLGPTESLRYFTGLVWHLSERLLGAVVTDDKLTYIVPGFERSRVETLAHLPGEIAVWEEEESPAALVSRLVGPSGKLALDDALPLAFYHAFTREMAATRLVDAGPVIRALRAIKSPAEIALIRYAMGITLDIHRKVHDTLAPGIAASDVARFI
ncbi:MAG: aminopeptidase P family N-terminal domain-containing protein, partial [Rhizobium sp.]